MLRFCRANPPMSPQNGREKNKAQILDLVYITSLTSSPTTFPFCLSMSTLLASYFLNAPSQTLCTFCSLFLECSFSRYLVVCSLISFGLWSNVTLLERSSFSPNSIPFMEALGFSAHLCYTFDLFMPLVQKFVRNNIRNAQQWLILAFDSVEGN